MILGCLTQVDYFKHALQRSSPLSSIILAPIDNQYWDGSHPASAISLISPVLLFLKTPIMTGAKPSPKGYFWVSSFGVWTMIYCAYMFYQLHALACTPTCINGTIDRGIVDFTAGLMDLLMEMAFDRQALPGIQHGWSCCSTKLTMLAGALASSPPPNWVKPPV